MTTQNENPAVLDFIQQIRDQEIERDNAIQNGLPALRRLVTIAQGDTGQCEKVRNLLLGLYNGHAFPFDLTQFRGLDKNIYDDCMAVVHMDARATVKEVHQYMDNGSKLFRSWAEGLNALKCINEA